jgi:RNA polymerase-binding transcription factor DksA
MAKTTKKVPAATATAPAGKAKGAEEEAKPTRSPLPKAFIEEQKAVLLAERARYLKSADALKAEADALVNEREPGDTQFDEESGEGDTLAVERERDLALSAQARAAVELIDAALARIEQGTYGICVHSGLAIPKERLEAIPWAAERVEFKTGSFRS